MPKLNERAVQFFVETAGKLCGFRFAACAQTALWLCVRREHTVFRPYDNWCLTGLLSDNKPMRQWINSLLYANE